MHGNNQLAMTNNTIPMVRKRNLRVVDEPPVGRQLLCKKNSTRLDCPNQGGQTRPQFLGPV